MAEWVEAGRTAILQLLEAEYAVVWLEVEAKTADHVWQPPRVSGWACLEPRVGLTLPRRRGCGGGKNVGRRGVVHQGVDSKAALMPALAREGSGRITVTDEYVHAALEELLAEGGVLARVMLAGTRRRRAAARHRVAACRPSRADRRRRLRGKSAI